jgi:hypothetical protein
MPPRKKPTTRKTDPLVLFAADPSQFQSALIVPSCFGPQRFGDIMAEFQRERFGQIAPALLSVANGQKPETGRWWWEATKGASKDSDLAVCLLWLLAFTKRPLPRSSARRLRANAKLFPPTSRGLTVLFPMS